MSGRYTYTVHIDGKVIYSTHNMREAFAEAERYKNGVLKPVVKSTISEGWKR